MKQIEVVATIIKHGKSYLATQRGYGEFESLWEFPGGKIKCNESKEEALKREIKEELNININIIQQLCTIEHTYPRFHLKMHCFICSIASETRELIEHKSAKWLTENELESVEWLPADEVAISQLLKLDLQ